MAVMEKDISIIISNIKGGDGGPYTIDYSNVQFVNQSFQGCPNWESIGDGFIIGYTGVMALAL